MPELTAPLMPEALYPTLYAPAVMESHKLLGKMQGDDPLVRRFVICTEDTLSKAQLGEGLANLQSTLTEYEPAEGHDVFVRLRNIEVAEQVLAMDGVKKLRGFVVPKADPDTYADWAASITECDSSFRIMPILESRGMNDYSYRKDLLEVLAAPEHRQKIDCLRIGGNDLMNNLGMRRPETMTIYDTVIGKLISDIVIEYRGTGQFPISAPAFEYFGPQYNDLFRKEMSQHIANQLFGQVVIHPRQLPFLWEAYKVDAEDLEQARYVTTEGTDAVIGDSGRLVNTSTHKRWAGTILLRSEMFGVR